MTEELDAVLFDAGGTLFDMDPSESTIIWNVLQKHGLRVEREQVEAANRKAKRTLDSEFAKCDSKNEGPFWLEYDRLIAEELGFKGDLGKLMEDLSEEFDKVSGDEKRWLEYPDARPLLEKLRRRDFRLGVVSNATDLLNRVMVQLDLTKYFEFVIASELVGVRKPRPEIFLMAAKKARAQPSRALYVGDRFAVDYVGAKDAGLQAILLDRDDTYAGVDCIKVRSLRALLRFL